MPGLGGDPVDGDAGTYAQRWEIETAFDQLKAHQRGMGEAPSVRRKSAGCSLLSNSHHTRYGVSAGQRPTAN